MNTKNILVGSICLVITLAFAVQCKSSGLGNQLASTSSNMESSDGKSIFIQKCEACHFDLSSEKKIGPGLAGLMKRKRFNNGMLADDYHLRRVIELGGKDMPPFRSLLTQKQIRDLIVYVRGL